MITVRFAGSGGQGIQRAGIVLAEAAIASGHNAVCAQTYGPESRGGASRSDVIVSDEEIVYPRPRQPDILIALSREAFRRFASDLREGGVLICDSEAGAPPAGVTTYAVPILSTAAALRASIAANVVALGVLCAVRPLVAPEALERALDARIRGDTARNRRALDAGMALGAQALAGQMVAGGLRS